MPSIKLHYPILGIGLLTAVIVPHLSEKRYTLSASLQSLQATNQAEHTHLRRDAESAIAQLTDDGQFLNHVREIIRFFKES